MITIDDNNNIKVLKSTLNMYVALQTICQPLADAFSINHFEYIKLYRDGKMFHLGTRPDWLLHFYKNKLYNMMQNFPFIFSNNCYFLDEYIEEVLSNPKTNDAPYGFIRVLEQAKKHFDICHTVIMTKQQGDTIELYCYSVPKTNHSFNRDFLKHLDFFETFNVFFKSQAKKIIQKAYLSRFLFAPLKPEHFSIIHYAKHKRELVDKIKNAFHINRYYLDGEYEGLYLTQREVDCLLSAIQNKTYEQISKELSVSVSTVRVYIDKLKSKLGCYSKKDLLRTISERKLINTINGKINIEKQDSYEAGTLLKTFFRKENSHHDAVVAIQQNITEKEH